MSINLSQITKSTDEKPADDIKKTPDKIEKKDEEKKTKEGSVMDKINNVLLKFSGVPLTEKLFFVQHLSIMMKAGISLSAALNTLAKQTKNKKFVNILTEISGNVEKGVSFTESLKPHQKIFGELFVNMIEAGELSG
ncbi:type II secretion system F family protein, partial [Candidatus Parcubacteria bacterium]|nr:type II secretion system F family protein [Candidatus Parcubacteria bacterium]